MMSKKVLGWVAGGFALLVPVAVVAQVNFSDGETLASQKLNTLASTAPPIGSVEAYVGSTTQLPAGWLLCDGSPVPTNSPLRALFVTTPDLRGMFLRGTGGSGPAVRTSQANATAVNGLSFPHSHATRIIDNAGSAGCNSGFSGQTSQRVPGPQIEWTVNAATAAAGGCMYDSGAPIDVNHSTTTTAAAATIRSTDTETRPANVGVNWIIRVL